MVWIDLLEDLQFYNQTPGVDCYCDLLVEANDLILQAIVPPSPTGKYTLKVEVLQPDGLVVFEDASIYFEWYVFQGVNGVYYMNMRATRFSPAMCANSCFILRVTIGRLEGKGEVSYNRIVFQKYTERYCVDNCCLVAKDITIDSTGVTDLGEYDALDYNPIDYLAS